MGVVTRVLLVVWVVGCTSGRVERPGDGGMDGGPPVDAGRDSGPPPVRDAGLRDTGAPTPDTGPPRRPESRCDDDVDNDLDELVDCADPDCDDRACSAMLRCIDGTCGGCADAPAETACGDGRDEDCDGLLDCADPDCDTAICGPGDVTCGSEACPCPSGFEERECADGSDDDCDGLTDCSDPDCLGRVCGGGGEICVGGTCTCPLDGTSEVICDGVDDDCSGVVDDGCPDRLALCCPDELLPVGNAEGTVWSDLCPPGAALVGVRGGASDRVDQLQPVCAALFVEADEVFPENLYRVRRGAPFMGAIHGGSGGEPFEDLCPQNDVLTGIRGGADPSRFVTSVSLVCARLSIARSADDVWELRRSPSVTLPARGGEGGDPYDASCAIDAILTGISGRADTEIAALGFQCQTLSLTLR